MRRIYATGVLACAALAACSDAGTAPAGDENVAEASEAVTTNCDYLNPGIHAPLPIPVVFNRELLIRDLPVVEDPCRATTAGCGSPADAAWTFKMLMTQMAGVVPVGQFVGEWLHQWEIPLVVNGFAVPARSEFRRKFLDPWVTASGCPLHAPIVGPMACPLNLDIAPFRLLAIVNRIDAADFVGGAPPTHDPEARFVFGFLDGGGAPLQATVIFEYKVPPTRFGVAHTTFDWAVDWHGLSNPALGPVGSPAYLAAITPILADITKPGAYAGKPNLGSAIGQVRTNEIDFGLDPRWHMREFHLTDVGMGVNAELLRTATLNQNPDDTTSHTVPLDNWLNANSIWGGSPALTTFTFTVAPPLLGGEATAPFTWTHSIPGRLTVDERANFGFATCNGCHTVETVTTFTHVSPRPVGVVAGLSPLLSQTTAPGAPGLPAGDLAVLDPGGSGVTLHYNEPWRRVCEVTAILDGAPLPYTRGNGMH